MPSSNRTRLQLVTAGQPWCCGVQTTTHPPRRSGEATETNSGTCPVTATLSPAPIEPNTASRLVTAPGHANRRGSGLSGERWRRTARGQCLPAGAAPSREAGGADGTETGFRSWRNIVAPGPAIRSTHRDLPLAQEAVSRGKLVAVADELVALVAQFPVAMWILPQITETHRRAACPQGPGHVLPGSGVCPEPGACPWGSIICPLQSPCRPRGTGTMWQGCGSFRVRPRPVDTRPGRDPPTPAM